MNSKYLIVLSSLIATVAISSADNLRWLSTEYDFGTIREESGKAHGEVKFVNLGPEATMIQRVKSTCGCTGVGYTEGIIAPGDTATVWFDYNPAGRPGRFIKHVKAYTGVDNDLTSIAIKGTVIGAPQSLDTKYPVAAGLMRLSADEIPMGQTTYGTARHEFIHGYNQSTDTLHLSWTDVPDYISLGASSLHIEPGDLFTLSAYLNTRDGAPLGSLDAPITLIASFKGKESRIPVHVTANIVPDTSALSEQELRDAPFASLFPTQIDLGDIDDAGEAAIEFTLRNEGNTPLAIKRIHCPKSPQLIKIKSMPKAIKPDQLRQVKCMVDKALLPTGLFKIGIEVVSDDPLHPVRTLYITGNKLQ